MKFQFRLQSIMKLREAERNEKQAELAEAIQADQILVQQVLSINQKLNDVSVEIRDVQRTSIDVDHLLGMKRFQAELRGQIVELLNQRQQLEQEIARRQNNLAEANKSLKTIQKLEDNAKAEHRQEMDKKEQEVLDEFRVKGASESGW